MRIAIEGCVSFTMLALQYSRPNHVLQGHGTLHAIYASIKKSCEINNWVGVNLLIIGGDFQVL